MRTVVSRRTTLTSADPSLVTASLARDPRGRIVIPVVTGVLQRTGSREERVPPPLVLQASAYRLHDEPAAFTSAGAGVELLHGRRLTAFDLAADGSLSARRVWAELGEGTPDGICLDATGCVWYADVPNQRCVRVREGGEVLEVVEVDRGCFACMLGGDDGRTLFIVAARWGGTEGIGDGAPTGQVLTYRATGAHAGRP